MSSRHNLFIEHIMWRQHNDITHSVQQKVKTYKDKA